MFDGFRKAVSAAIQHATTLPDRRIRVTVAGFDEVVTAGYRGSPYVTYDEQVEALSKKYNGEAEWGNVIVENIINIRAAFSVGDGISPYIKDETGDRGQKELAYIEQFIVDNDLDEEVPLDWARDAEIEGKALIRLILKGKQIKARLVPYTQHNYEIKTATGDYAEYTSAEYNLNKNKEHKKIVLKPAEFVFARFGGRTAAVNKTFPKCGKILPQTEALDKALWDWRKVNHLFGSPTPYIKAADSTEAKAINRGLTNRNWKIGKVLVTTGEFSLVSLDGTGSQSIEKEIVSLAKIVSGTVGVPVHFLGLPDLMSNRSTAENLTELVTAATAKERRIWIGAYEELFSKVLSMAPDQNFDTDAIGCNIPHITSQKMKELVDIWMPLNAAGLVSDRTTIEQIPGIKPDEEIERIEAEKAERMETMLEKFRTAPEPNEENEEKKESFVRVA